MWIRCESGELLNLAHTSKIWVTINEMKIGNKRHAVIADYVTLFSGTREECENVLNGIMEALVNKGQWLMTKEADEIQVETFGRR